MSNFERIIPVLTYQDIPAAHDFLVHAFGFNAGGVYRNAEPYGQREYGARDLEGHRWWFATRAAVQHQE